MRSSPHIYPWANVLHVLGVALLVGAIGILDLRIAGAWRRLPLEALSAALTPLAATGVAVQAASGLVLFAADGQALAASGVFHAKLALMAAALLNAALFRWRWRSLAHASRTRGEVVAREEPPASARLLALASLALWIAVLILGRLIAYA
ncbi:hypothetical protein EYB45_06785 [Erythrobacteraceae bacterium CFH 75059]|nr:hypothetical protein EYB45_06785 [Erythrobacteraceae bacterium CFH 75059]